MLGAGSLPRLKWPANYRPVRTTVAWLLLSLIGEVVQASDAPVRHSLQADYGFMIGRWTCHFTQAGTPDREVGVEYEWSYGGHIMRETMRIGDRQIGEFLTSYDTDADGFKGVGVGAWGYVVWENQGFHEGHASETGYAFNNGRMTAVSRSEFERLSDTHYIVRDFDADTASSKGLPTDTEDCVKVK